MCNELTQSTEVNSNFSVFLWADSFIVDITFFQSFYFTLNLLILHTSIPTFCPDPCHAFSFSADSFFT